MLKEKKNKYSIRKLSVGVGSVIIGFILCSPIYADTDAIKNELSNFVVSKYYAKDTDNDGIIDRYDREPEKWNVTDRDLRLFTELAYRTSDELTKIFNKDQAAIADFNSTKLLNVTDVSEIVNNWQFVKQIHQTNGFSATIFTNGREAVVSIAGTNDGNDGDDDIDIFNGAQPGQVNSLKEIVSALSEYDNYYLTGHSLGGYLAVYMAASYLYNNNQLKHVAVFNAPGIKDSWSWISGNLLHRTTTENSLKLTDELSAPKINNDADSRFSGEEGFIQPYSINGDTVGGLYYYGNTRWANQINNGSKHSSTNFFGTKKDENFKKWFSTGYRLDTPYITDDSDFDGLTDKDELAIGTDLNTIDTDNDGYGDKIELASGTDPLDASSFPKLSDFYYSAVTKGLTFKTPTEIQKNTLIGVAATALDTSFEALKDQIPILHPSEVVYTILNEPDDWSKIPGKYDVLLQAKYKDNSISNVFKLPITISLNQLREEYIDKINQLGNLTENEKNNFINQLSTNNESNFESILLAAINLNDGRTGIPETPTTGEEDESTNPTTPTEGETPTTGEEDEPSNPTTPTEETPTTGEEEEPTNPTTPAEGETPTAGEEVEPTNPTTPTEETPTTGEEEEPTNPTTPIEVETPTTGEEGEPTNPTTPTEGETPTAGEEVEPTNPTTPTEETPTTGEEEEPTNPTTPIEVETPTTGEEGEPSNPTTPTEGETPTTGEEGEPSNPTTPTEGETPTTGEEGEPTNPTTPTEGETPTTGEEGEPTNPTTPTEGETPTTGEEDESTNPTTPTEGETPTTGEEVEPTNPTTPTESETPTAGEEEEPTNPTTPTEGETPTTGEEDEPSNPTTPTESETPTAGEEEEPTNPTTPTEGETPTTGEEGEPTNPTTPTEGETPTTGEEDEPSNPTTPTEGETPTTGEGIEESNKAIVVDVQSSNSSVESIQTVDKISNKQSSLLPKTGYQKGNSLILGITSLLISILIFFKRKNH
ncbi:YSIRK-type signal peptide-containing protein [Enterococcus columbae]|nr:YSIRK-type signal peptide-containing protein [Enterococcus columbae]